MRSVYLAALLLLGLTSARAADWPRFRGAAGDAIAPDTGINKDWKARPPKLLWKAGLTDNGFAGICVAEDKVFIIDHAGKQDVVRALDAAGGGELWRYAYDDAPNNSNGFARTTPTFDGGRIYTLSRLGKLHCLDGAGKLVWAVDFIAGLKGMNPRFKYSASPVVLGDKLIVVCGGKGNIAALDKLTGKVIWRGGNDEVPGYVTPVLATLGGRAELLYSSGFHLLSVDPENGKPLWSWEWPTYNGNNVTQPIVSGDTVFFSSGDVYGGTMLRLENGAPKEVWSTKDMQAQFNTPVVHGGFFYGTTDPVTTSNPGALICLDPATGKSRWRRPGFEKGPVMAIDGVLLALDGKTGELAMIDPDPKEYKEIGRITPLGDQSWTPPAVANGKLFIRNKKTLSCLDLK